MGREKAVLHAVEHHSLRTQFPKTVVSAAFSAYAEDSCFPVPGNGQCSCNDAFADKEESPMLLKMADVYLRARVMRDVWFFSSSMRLNGVLEDFHLH
jgi:hypothetical protein